MLNSKKRKDALCAAARRAHKRGEVWCTGAVVARLASAMRDLHEICTRPDLGQFGYLLVTIGKKLAGRFLT
jgi:hypothetical protein